MTGWSLAPRLAGPEVPPPERPRLLLLSFHFPPGQSVGGLRWQMLAPLAAEHGWGLDVVTVHPSSLDAPDAARLSALPPDTRVFGVPLRTHWMERLENAAARAARSVRGTRRPAPPPAPGYPAPAGPAPRGGGSYARDEVRWRLSRPRDWLRAYFALRTNLAELDWGLAAATLAQRLIQPGLHRAIISCGPPHMVHEAARRLAARTGLPLVVDMRDPWSLVNRLPEDLASPVVYWMAGRFEPRAVREAMLVVTNTAAARRELQARYPAAAERILTVMNGYDEDPMPAPRPGPRFVLAYAGTIYLDRDPRPLFQAAARVIRESGLLPADFGIELIGNADNYGGVPVSTIAQEEGISAFVTTGPPRPRQAAMEFLAGATMLVSLPQDSHLAIPSKIYEYLRFEAWVLALAEPGSATAEALDQSGVDVVAPDDVDGMARVLAGRVRAFRAGSRPGRPTGVAHLSRRAQAEPLFQLLADRLGLPRPASPV